MTWWVEETTMKSSAPIKAMKRLLHVLVIAFMLGISNVIMQEQRFVDDSATMVQQEDGDETDDPLL